MYKLITIGYKDSFDCYSTFSLFFPIPSYRGSLTLYIPPLDHLDSTLVNHLSFHLSVCPIRDPLWLSVSCDSQCSTVQGSSQHKCGQESSCSAFNAVVAAFPKIFLRSHHPWMFMIHIFVTGASWKVLMIVRTRIWYVFIMPKEILLLGPSSHLYFAHWVLDLNHSLPFTHPRTAQFSVKAKSPIHDLGP